MKNRNLKNWLLLMLTLTGLVYFYVKSDKNIIIYLDSSTVNTLQIENIKSKI